MADKSVPYSAYVKFLTKVYHNNKDLYSGFQKKSFTNGDVKKT